MNKYKHVLLFILFLVWPSNVIFAICSTEEIENFRKLDEEYTYTYELDKETKTYAINFHNPAPDKYGYILSYEDNQGNEIIMDFKDQTEEDWGIVNLKPTKYTIYVVGKTDTCDKQLRRTRLKLYKYNPFSEDPLCKGIEEFVLCQETYSKDIDYETFVSRVTKYKENLPQKEEEPPKKEESIIVTYATIVFELFKKYIVVISISVVIITLLIIGIVRLAKKIRKSRRLE